MSCSSDQLDKICRLIDQSTINPGHVIKLLELIGQSGISKGDLGSLLGSGLLTDLFKADTEEVDRGEFRRTCGLPSRDWFTPLLTPHHSHADLVALTGSLDREGEWDEEGFVPVREWAKDLLNLDFRALNRDNGEILTGFLYYDEDLTTAQAFLRTAQEGFRPASVKHLLSWVFERMTAVSNGAAQYRSLESSTVAMGSYRILENGTKVFPCAIFAKKGIRLCFMRADKPFPSGTRFMSLKNPVGFRPFEELPVTIR